MLHTNFLSLEINEINSKDFYQQEMLNHRYAPLHDPWLTLLEIINSFQENEWKPFWHWRSLWTWPLTYWPKINRGHLLVMTNPHVKWTIVLKKMSRNHFDIQDHCDLDLWPTDSKIDRGHKNVKDFVINGFQYNQQKPFWNSWSLWPWQSDPKI